MEKLILSGLRILNEGKWLDHYALIIEGNKIKTIIPDEMIAHHLPAKQHHFHDNHMLIPGLIDLHMHGANGADVMDGTDTALQTISKSLAREGITHFLATTMTAPVEKIESVLTFLGQDQSLPGAKLAGIHLEGPFISNMKLGAQPDYTMAPNLDLFWHWQKLANNKIQLVTLAPELPKAIEFIKNLKTANIVTSVGHTNATYAEVVAAIKAGVTHATHLFNAMSGIHQREPGAVTALLLSPIINAEIIVDGIHLHPAIVKLIYEMKHKDNLLLITDSMRAKCLANGDYDLGGQMVNVTNNIARLNKDTLAGSTLKMPAAIKNMQEFSECSLIDAIEMASKNPAQILSLRNKGYIDAGMDADLVVLNEQFEVEMTFCEGVQVYPF